MSIFSKFLGFLGSTPGKAIVDAVKGHFPAKLSEAERQKIEMAILEASRTHEIKLLELAQEEQSAFDQRVRDLEGTAKDLGQSRWGKFVLFLRGAQRPIWGYLVIYLDIMVFSGRYKIFGSESSLQVAQQAQENAQAAQVMILEAKRSVDVLGSDATAQKAINLAVQAGDTAVKAAQLAAQAAQSGGGTVLPGSEYMGLESAFWLVNFLVLGFLFGERAMKNVLPLLRQKLPQQQQAQG